MSFEELEIKILNIDINEIHSKLLKLNSEYKGEIKQIIYTYDCYDPIIMYELVLKDYKITKSKNSLLKLSNIYSQLEPVISEDEKKIINSICNYDSIVDYIENNLKNVDLIVLENENILKIIKETKNRFFKWIRLRKSNNKVELCIKYIYNTDKEYNIDEVKEIEVEVNDFEVTNLLIEEMGYFRKKMVEKIRKKYIYNDVEIVIDIWPLIKPYMEIEAKSIDSIYDVVETLGYDKNDTRVMNTEDVYLEEGYNLNDFEILTFDKEVIAEL